MKTQNNSQIKIIHSIASIIIDSLSIISSIIILIVESLYNWSSWWWILLTPVITFAGSWILLICLFLECHLHVLKQNNINP